MWPRAFLETLIKLDELLGAILFYENAATLFCCEAAEMLYQHEGEEIMTKFQFLGKLILWAKKKNQTVSLSWRSGETFCSIEGGLGQNSTQSETWTRAKSSHALRFSALLRVLTGSVNTCMHVHTHTHSHSDVRAQMHVHSCLACTCCLMWNPQLSLEQEVEH